MPAEVVIDASVAVKCFVIEKDSDAALEAVLDAGWVIAPEFIHVEIASVAAKRLKRGDISEAVARDCVSKLDTILNDVFPAAPLAPRAFEFATHNGFSAYDGLYLALAEERHVRVLTADERLVRRATAADLGHLVALLQA
ncbi:MAG: type II toxin-antitoxin system VapC family toxin [Caulobacter sp.]|nr:type II toxin-antitoxin system VapC family toxin [Caulobacter sp.]